MSKRVSLRKLKTGNELITLNGISGVYLGSYYPIMKGWYQRNVEILRTKRAIVGQLNVDGKSYESVQLISSLKVSEITNTRERSKADCLADLNSYLKHGDVDGYRFPSVVGFTQETSLREEAGAALKPLTYSEAAASRADYTIVIAYDDGTYGLWHSYQMHTGGTDILVRNYDTLPVAAQPSAAYTAIRLPKTDLQMLKLFRIVNHITTAEGCEIDVVY
jgi:hypothetical protein